jgi:hypothetical protein
VLVARTRVATEARDKGRVIQLWQAEVTNSFQPERVSHGIVVLQSVSARLRGRQVEARSGHCAGCRQSVSLRAFFGAPIFPDGGREGR